MSATTVVAFVFLAIITLSSAEVNSMGYKILKKVYDQCDSSNDMVKCLKVQALKFADRALHSNSFKIIDGVYIVRDETARAFSNELPNITDEKIDQLQSNQIDGLLSDTTEKFFETHKIKLDIPKLVEEGRGKMRKHMGALLAAMAIKGGMFAMAMKGVAMMAGMALMMSKMALMMSSIIGLKKLMGGGGGEKTTVEIVKHPQFSYGSSYSSSYEDAGHGGGGGGGYGSSGGGGGNGGGHGGYHRSLETNNQVSPQERVYNAHVPNKLR